LVLARETLQEANEVAFAYVKLNGTAFVTGDGLSRTPVSTV
jgi:hypothetical protein